MRARISTSIRQLALLGFALVVLPLAVGLVSTVLQVDRLALCMERALGTTTQAVEAGRLIASQALSMERSAEQYLLLGDVALLLRYESSRNRLAEEIERLEALSTDRKLSRRLESLKQREEALYRKLLATSDEELGKVRLTTGERLSEVVRPIPFEVTRMVTRNSEQMSQRVAEVQKRLLWQALALIPLALLMAALFGTLISRPLRRLGATIRRLGEGHFSEPVEIKGPQDIRQLAEELEWMRQQLAALDEQKLQFLRHISHELKTPLTAIREGAGLLHEEVTGQLTEEQREVTRILEESSHQLQGQVESLLNFNLALAQQKRGKGHPLDLEPLVRSVVDRHRLPAQARNIRLELQLQPAWVSAVEGQLRLIIDNLLSNAIKYTPDGGWVQLVLRCAGGRVELDVSNSGAGIAREDRPHIFEPFYQGKSVSHGPLKGTGLGLSIVLHYVMLNEGDIKLLEVEEGACFRVIFPSLEGNSKCIAH